MKMVRPLRRVRSVLLSCVLAVVALLGTAPAASAAPAAFGIEWQVWGTVYGQDGTVSLCPTVTAWDPAQTLQLQVLQNGTWVTKRTYAAGQLQYWDCAEPTVASLVGSLGTYQLRAVTSATVTSQAAAAQTTVTLARGPGSVEVASTAYTFTTASKGVRATVSHAHAQHLVLQRKSGTAWVTVSSATAPNTGASVPLRLAVSNLAGLSWYRVVMGSTPFETAFFSSSFPIHQTDAVRYGSYIALARRYMTPFCPLTPIFINTPAVSPGQWAVGMAPYSWSSWNGSNTLTSRIELRAGLTATSLRHVALHECGHVVQSRAMVEKRYDIEEAAANRLYPGTGMEGQADCMAYSYVRSARDLYYVRGCSAAQLSDAYRMWHAYGWKYQSPVYTWKS
jgi:hypothetical protein